MFTIVPKNMLAVATNIIASTAISRFDLSAVNGSVTPNGTANVFISVSFLIAVTQKNLRGMEISKSFH